MAIVKYDCPLCRIAATRLTGDRFISWHVTRVIFGILPWFIVVLTRKAEERSLLSTTRRSSSSMDPRTRAPLSTSGHKYSGRRQQGAPDPRKSARSGRARNRGNLICVTGKFDCRWSRGPSFHNASNSSSWKSFSECNYGCWESDNNSRLIIVKNCLTN